MAVCVGVSPAIAAEPGRSADGPNHLLVTFADRPDTPTAAARLRGLGPVAPVVPEVGIWRVVVSDAATARARALARNEVRIAEWSLAHTSDALNGRSPSVDPEPLTDPFFAPGYQWGLFATTWRPALIGVGPRPRIAILDSGVDRTHEEWSGTPSALVDPYDAYGERIGPNVANDWGNEGHGTHVAGIVAAPRQQRQRRWNCRCGTG